MYKSGGRRAKAGTEAGMRAQKVARVGVGVPLPLVGTFAGWKRVILRTIAKAWSGHLK